MVALRELLSQLRQQLLDGHALDVSQLKFEHQSAVFLFLIVLFSLALGMLLIHFIMGGKAPNVAVPAVLRSVGGSPVSWLRYSSWIFLLAGLPFFALALAGPYTAMSEQQTVYPGRRIVLMIDASSSMTKPFTATRLVNTNVSSKAVFFTTVAAAQAFIRQRSREKYRDLIGLIEFGDEAYVVTPFTTDYNNVLLSASLIGDWTEFVKFPDQGTRIGVAIEQAIRLFKAFDFLDASGNALVIFTDGQDTQVTNEGKTVTQVLAGAAAAKIPVFFVRTSLNRRLGDILPDAVWKPAVEATGGRFFAAANEQDILHAIRAIDQLSAGSIRLRQYSTRHEQFAPFALLAIAFWSLGLFLRLGIPAFSKFP